MTHVSNGISKYIVQLLLYSTLLFHDLEKIDYFVAEQILTYCSNGRSWENFKGTIFYFLLLIMRKILELTVRWRSKWWLGSGFRGRLSESPGWHRAARLTLCSAKGLTCGFEQGLAWKRNPFWNMTDKTWRLIPLLYFQHSYENKLD